MHIRARDHPQWRAAMYAGFVATVAYGIFLHATTNVMPLIGAAIGTPSAIAGWTAHLVAGTIFGMLYAGATGVRGVRYAALSPAHGLVLGVVFGVVLWFMAFAVGLPLWLAVVGGPILEIPYLRAMPLFGHIIYGVILGFLYPLLVRADIGVDATAERFAT